MGDKVIQRLGWNGDGDPLVAVSADNPLPVSDKGNVAATAFATTSNVASGVTFSSGLLSTVGYSQAQTEILSDKDGTLTFSFYSDESGIDLIRSINVPYLSAAGYQLFGAATFGSYVKYEFENTEATDTTDFFYTTKMLTSAMSSQMIRTDGYVAPAMIASLTRSVNHFPLDSAREKVVGQVAEYFVGFNGSVGTAWEDVWGGGGDYPWQTSSFTVEVVSSDAADNGTTPGLGLHSVEIDVLSATGVESTEEILLNGTTPVSGTLTCSRVNIVHAAESCGTYGGSHQGDITCRIAGAGATLSVMTGREGAAGSSVQYGSGESKNGFYTVPLGKVMYITQIEVAPDVSASKTMDVVLYERENYLDVTTPFSPIRELWGGDKLTEAVTVPFPSHEKIKPLTDIWFRAKSSGGSQAVDVRVDYYLVDEDASGK